MDRPFIIDGRAASPLPATLAFAPIANPAANEVRFSLALPSASVVRLEIIDVTGRVIETVLDETREAGVHLVAWTANARAGVYFGRLRTGQGTVTRRFILLP